MALKPINIRWISFQLFWKIMLWPLGANKTDFNLIILTLICAMIRCDKWLLPLSEPNMNGNIIIIIFIHSIFLKCHSPISSFLGHSYKTAWLINGVNRVLIGECKIYEMKKKESRPTILTIKVFFDITLQSLHPSTASCME